MFEVPNKAPIDVPIASAKRARSIFELNPENSSKASSSSAEKIPVLRPVPIKVPKVSKVSERLKAKIVINTTGKRLESLKSEPMPSKAARKVVPSSPKAVPKLLLAKLTCDKSTTPIGIPRRVVATIPIRIAPRTFFITNMAVKTKPKTARMTFGSVKVEIAGTTFPLAKTEDTPFSKVSAVASVGETPLTVMMSAADVEKVIILAFLKPRYAIKTPKPPPIACWRVRGIAFIMLFRNLVTVIKMLNKPQRKTIAKASCQENLRPITTV